MGGKKHFDKSKVVWGVRECRIFPSAMQKKKRGKVRLLRRGPCTIAGRQEEKCIRAERGVGMKAGKVDWIREKSI